MTRPGDAPVDWWSIPHLVAGIILGLLVAPWWAALGMLIGYECIEAGLRKVPQMDGGLFEHESRANVVADVAIGFVGWWLGSLSPWRWIVLPW